MSVQDAAERRPAAAGAAPRFHHVAVQTGDLENSAAWYEAFLGCRRSWSLTAFSDLTRSRLPGIRSLTELVVGDTRLHLFEREGRPAPGPGDSVVQFQHLCLSVESAERLSALRERWIDLYASHRYTFALAEQPTDIVVDDDGVRSFYAYDPNGLELEFTFVPQHDRGR
jgi:catechol 2,3-dioxygenase-like lactoylglutathione lyase family enzyme